MCGYIRTFLGLLILGQYKFLPLFLYSWRVTAGLDIDTIPTCVGLKLWNVDFTLYQYGPYLIASDTRNSKIFLSKMYWLGRKYLLNREGYAYQSLKLKFK